MLSTARDGVALIGLALITYGLYLAWVPLAFIFPGLVLVTCVIIVSYKGHDNVT